MFQQPWWPHQTLWDPSAKGVTHRGGPAAPQGWWLQPLLGSAGTQRLLKVAPSGIASLPTHEVVELWGLGVLWRAPSSSSRGCSPSSVLKGSGWLEPFPLMYLCCLLLKSMPLVMVSLLWDCCPPSKLAPKCSFCLGQPQFGKCPRRTTLLPTMKCPM